MSAADLLHKNHISALPATEQNRMFSIQIVQDYEELRLMRLKIDAMHTWKDSYRSFWSRLLDPSLMRRTPRMMKISYALGLNLLSSEDVMTFQFENHNSEDGHGVQVFMYATNLCDQIRRERRNSDVEYLDKMVEIKSAHAAVVRYYEKTIELMMLLALHPATINSPVGNRARTGLTQTLTEVLDETYVKRVTRICSAVSNLHRNIF